MNQPKTIAVIGLGYVGLPLAVEFGKHRPTIGFDIHQARISELQAGQDHTLECSSEELAQASHLRYSANPADLQAAQIYIVTVPTPADQANRPDMTPLVKASETVGKVLKAGDIVIYESTVYKADKVSTLTTIHTITNESTPAVAEEVEHYRQIITAGTHKASNIKEAKAAQPFTNTEHSLTGFEPFAARGAIVTDKLPQQLRDEACF